MTRSVPAKLSGQSAPPTRVSTTRAGLYVFSNNKKGPNRPNRTGPPDGLAVCLPGCNRLKLPGCSSDFAYHKYSGIRTYFKEKIALKTRGFGQCRKLVFVLWNAPILLPHPAGPQLRRGTSPSGFKTLLDSWVWLGATGGARSSPIQFLQTDQTSQKMKTP